MTMAQCALVADHRFRQSATKCLLKGCIEITVNVTLGTPWTRSKQDTCIKTNNDGEISSFSINQYSIYVDAWSQM
jgi:hypothetical protein